MFSKCINIYLGVLKNLKEIEILQGFIFVAGHNVVVHHAGSLHKCITNGSSYKLKPLFDKSLLMASDSRWSGGYFTKDLKLFCLVFLL